MDFTDDECKAIKKAVDFLFENPSGQALIEFLEEISGKYMPNYEPAQSSTIILEAGRRQIVSILHNFHRLTQEQVLVKIKELKGIS